MKYLLELLEAINVIPISSSIDTYAQELARLQLEGCIIDDFDLLIASTSVVNSMVLVSDNTHHLQRVQGVVIENWINR